MPPTGSRQSAKTAIRQLTLLIGLTGFVPAFAVAASPVPEADLGAMAGHIGDLAGATGIRFKLIVNLPTTCAQGDCTAQRETARQDVQQILDRLVQLQPAASGLLQAGRITWEGRVAAADQAGKGIQLEVEADPPRPDATCPAEVALTEPWKPQPLPLGPGSAVTVHQGARLRLVGTTQAPMQVQLERMSAEATPLQQARLDLTPLDWPLEVLPARLRIVPAPRPVAKNLGDSADPWPVGQPAGPGCVWMFSSSEDGG